MKKFLVLLASALVFWIISVIFLAKDPASTEPKKLYPIVRLVIDGKTFCSGSVINKTTILTAAHCLIIQDPLGMRLNDSPIEIRPYHNLSIGVFGKAYYATPQMDQGLINGDFSLFDTLPYISKPEQQEKIRTPRRKLIACGYPMGGDLYCTNVIYDRQEEFFMLVHGVLISGMSGGPTLLQDGTIVGVNVAVSQDESVISPIYNIDKEIK